MPSTTLTPAIQSDRHPLSPLLQPGNIAVIGASARTDRPGYMAIKACRSIGFRGKIYPVTPSYDSIDELECYPAIGDVPEPVDLAVLACSANRMEEALHQAVSTGCKAVTIFADCEIPGDSDPPLSDRLAMIARQAGLPLLGPNTIGFLNFDNHCAGSFISEEACDQGTVAAIIHSGATAGYLTTVDPRVRFNLLVHPGKEAVLSVADYLDYALQLPSTCVIALIVETVRDAKSFINALSKASDKNIPVVILKFGRSEKGAAHVVSHSGNLAGAATIFDAACRQQGAVLTESMDEWLTTITLMEKSGPLDFKKIAAVVKTRYEGNLLLDHAREVGYSPDDLEVRVVEEEGENDTLSCIERAIQENEDSLIVGFTEFGVGEGDEDISDMTDALLSAHGSGNQPLVAACFSSRQFNTGSIDKLTAVGLPVLDGGTEALRAIRNAQSYQCYLADRRQQAPSPKPQCSRDKVSRFLELARHGDETAGFEALSEIGVPVVPSRNAATVEEVLSAAREIGFPVVLKTGEGHAHKSDMGGVRLNLGNESELKQAYNEISKQLGPKVIVSAMAPAGEEVAVGIINDPQFGPTTVVATGGTLIEVINDAVFETSPISKPQALKMLRELRAFSAVEDAPEENGQLIETLSQIVADISAFSVEFSGAISELDVNPIIVGKDGCFVVDVLMKFKEETE
jgi:acetate---CoA ligase (ADP-forming)